VLQTSNARVVAVDGNVLTYGIDHEYEKTRQLPSRAWHGGNQLTLIVKIVRNVGDIRFAHGGIPWKD